MSETQNDVENLKRRIDKLDGEMREIKEVFTFGCGDCKQRGFIILEKGTKKCRRCGGRGWIPKREWKG